MDTPRSRLAIGIAAVALAAGLCFAAVWSIRGRLPAQPVAVAPAGDAALRAENLRLRAEVARLSAERDANRPPHVLVTASPVPAPEQAPGQGPAQMPAQPAHPHHTARADPTQPQYFSAPQTFTSISTAN